MNSLRRLVLALLAVVASTLTVVGVGLSTPAHAVTTVTTKTYIHLNYPRRAYNQKYSIYVQVQVPADNAYVDDNHGSFRLQRRYPGGTWKTVATSPRDSGRTWTYRATRAASYRAVYLGYKGSDYNATASTSKTVSEKVTRNLHDNMKKINNRTYQVHGTVAPGYKHSRITLQKATCPSKCAWHKVTTFKTDGSSHYSHNLPLYKKATYFRLMIPSSSRYVTSYSNHWFETYPI